MNLKNRILNTRKEICMAININKLRNGEIVKCPCCNKGVLNPANGTTPDKAGNFKCSECGEKLHLNFRIKKD